MYYNIIFNHLLSFIYFLRNDTTFFYICIYRWVCICMCSIYRILHSAFYIKVDIYGAFLISCYFTSTCGKNGIFSIFSNTCDI